MNNIAERFALIYEKFEFGFNDLDFVPHYFPNRFHLVNFYFPIVSVLCPFCYDTFLDVIKLVVYPVFKFRSGLVDKCCGVGSVVTAGDSFYNIAMFIECFFDDLLFEFDFCFCHHA